LAPLPHLAAKVERVPLDNESASVWAVVLWRCMFWQAQALNSAMGTVIADSSPWSAMLSCQSASGLSGNAAHSLGSLRTASSS
jgi:hypothetical protein